MNLRKKIQATDWLSDLSYAGGECDVVLVQFKNTRSGFYRNPQGLPLEAGDMVAVEASPGHDIGRIVLTGQLVALKMRRAGIARDAELPKVFRIAKTSDLEKFDEARAREHETMIRSRQIAAELNLNMKIGDVEYQGDGAKAIFYYIADERVDFRKLIRILADTFKVRIEMKQIGARQEAGRIGGIGPCGRPLCCSSWLNKFVSVGTGSARLQDLSMNPQKLAGQCAKLKCCLNFETAAYADASSKLPPRDIPLETIDGTYYHFKTDILAGKITYSTDKHLAINLVTLDAARAFEIIRLNRMGEKVDSLLPTAPEQAKEYIDLAEQDSLTRFDKERKKKKKKQKNAARQAPQHPPREKAKERSDARPDRPEKPRKGEQKAQQASDKKRPHKEQKHPQEKGGQQRQSPNPKPKGEHRAEKDHKPKDSNKAEGKQQSPRQNPQHHTTRPTDAKQ